MNRERYMKLFFLMLFMASVVLAPFSQASAQERLMYDDVEEALWPYMTVTDDGVFFDKDKAIADGMSEEQLLIGETVNRLNDAYGQGEMSLQLSIPIWGNWCGPGHGGGFPQDLLDQGCMQHDGCYAEKGYFSCECDEALIAHIDRHFSEMKFFEKLVALGVKFFFTVMICR
ncbi:hypothetical protein NSQ26_00265 [Bacillus sp. FSL W7-1360]